MNKKFGISFYFILGVFLTWLNMAHASQISYSLGVDADYVKQEVTTESDDLTYDTTNQVISPYLQANYTGPRLLLQGRVTNDHVKRELQQETFSDDYVSYNYSGQYQVIENLLTIDTIGSQRYFSSQIQSFDVDNFLLNSENLGKSKNEAIGASLNIPRGDIFGLNAVSRYRKSSFNRSGNTNPVGNTFFDNESSTFSFNALSGTDLNNARIIFGGTIANIKRENRQDFDSENLNASIDINLVQNLALAINGFYESNEIQPLDSEEEFDGLNEFSSVGVGLIYQRGPDKFFEIAYNRSKSEGRQGADDDENNFVSVDFAWAFTERTNARGNYSRRFYGDAGSFSFSHKLRNWSSSIRYNESVTSQSQLINTTIPGLAICDENTLDLSECSFSNSPDVTLGEGQFTIPIEIEGFGINDRIVIRKSLSAQTRVTRRRSIFSMTASHTDTEEVEIDRLIERTSLRTKLSFNISHKSQLVLSHTFSDLQLENSGELDEQIVNEYGVELKRRLSDDFSASLIASYLNRNGEAAGGFGVGGQFQGLDGPLNDRRLTLRISYKFANGRFQ